MTFAMSSEGDSAKSALSDANEKNATDSLTDSSQDSTDLKAKAAKEAVENNVESKADVEKPKEDTTEEDSEQESDKGSVTSEKKEDVKKPTEKEPKEEKPQNDTDAAKKEESKKEEKEVKGKEEAKVEKKEKKEEVEEEEAEGEEEELEEEEEEEEEASEEERKKKGKKKGVPLLDQPLETSGKRERKNVQRFEEEFKSEAKESVKVEFEEGSGTPLGEIPRIEACITRFRNDDLKNLHRVLFKAVGKATMIKKNIKKFNGFNFKKDSEEYKKKVAGLQKFETKSLKVICEQLDLFKTGTKDEIVERIMDFLIDPKDSGKQSGGGRPKRASAVRANNRGYSSHDDYSSDEKHLPRGRRDKGKRANLKDDSSSDEEFKPGDASDASDDKPKPVRRGKRGRPKKGTSEEEEASVSGATSDESDDEPKTKKRKVAKVNNKAKPKTPGKGRGRGRPSKAAQATPRKSGRGRRPKDESTDDEGANEKMDVDDGSSSEDEPLAKKKTKNVEPPTDDEIKTFIKSILEGANLEEITMKTVCQRVYDHYPDFDLTSKKQFIKSTVRSLIAT